VPRLQPRGRESPGDHHRHGQRHDARVAGARVVEQIREQPRERLPPAKYGDVTSRANFVQ